uniref:Uncharacterized protein n=1 Tax=Arundo donax TaxID=35708 RepID=A0A0A9GFA1_ARUDO
MGPESARPSSARRSTREVAGSHSTHAHPHGVASDSLQLASAPAGSESADLKTTSPSTSSFTGIGMSAATAAPMNSSINVTSRRSGRVGVVGAVISAAASCRVQNVSEKG